MKALWSKARAWRQPKASIVACRAKLALLRVGNGERGLTERLVKIVEGGYIFIDLSFCVRVGCCPKMAEGATRDEVKRTCDVFRGQIIDVTANTYTVQLTGPSDKLEAFIRAVGKTTILEVVRSGVSGISRGDKVLSV